MAVTLGGNPIEVSGSFPKVGDTAPDFKLVSGDLSDVSLADFAGKKKLLNIVPSLDTAGLRDLDQGLQRCGSSTAAVLMVISADLPFAQEPLLRRRRHQECGDAVDHARRRDFYSATTASIITDPARWLA